MEAGDIGGGGKVSEEDSEDGWTLGHNDTSFSIFPNLINQEVSIPYNFFFHLCLCFCVFLIFSFIYLHLNCLL